jgi:hypothetical protein
MRRREFLGAVATAVAASARVPLFAQASSAPPPKIMLFGFAVVSKDGTSIVARLPTVGTHRTFLAGTSAVIGRLAAAMKKTPVPGFGSGIGDGHNDLKGKDIQLLCLTVTDIIIGKKGDATNLQANLEDFVPRIPVVASKMRAGSYAFANYPKDTTTLSLSGGTLRMPGVKSNNQGTHDIAWQFQLDGKDVDKTYKLTDLLVFDSAAGTIDLSLHGVPAPVTLQSGEQLWFVNVPMQQDEDKTVTTIEHAHDWFSLLTPAVSGKIEAVTKTPFTRTKGTVRFKHPCAPPVVPTGKPPVMFFPPDTDPCFAVMA